MIALVGYAGAITGIYTALALLVPRHKNPTRLFGGVLFLALAYALFLLTVFNQGILTKFPHLIFTQLPVAAATGPLLYFFIRSAASADFRLRAGHTAHFLPALLCALYLAPFYLLPAETKQQLLADPMLLTPYFAQPTMMMLFAVSYFSPIPYLLVSAFHCRVFLSKGDFPVFRAMAFFITLCAAALLLMLAAVVMPKIGALKTSALGIFALAMAVAFIGLIRSPRFPELLRRDARRFRQQNRIGIEPARSIVPRLKQLIGDEKIYLDEDLKVADVARRLSIRADQLSQVLSDELNTNFNRLINGYRVRESCRLLRERPELNILEVALASGFNAKSAFNAAFKAETGLSPTSYKKRPES